MILIGWMFVAHASFVLTLGQHRGQSFSSVLKLDKNFSNTHL